MKIFKWLLPSDNPPRPSPEALRERAAVEAIRPRVQRAVSERDRLLGENNYTARIRALYQEGLS